MPVAVIDELIDSGFVIDQVKVGLQLLDPAEIVHDEAEEVRPPNITGDELKFTMTVQLAKMAPVV